MLSVIANLDLRELILYAPGHAGVSISYPSIALHALGTHESPLLPGNSSVVFLQVNIHDPETVNSDDEIHTLDLTIYATDTSPPPSQAGTAEEGDEPVPNAVKALFDALSTCADLHPDPASPDSNEAEEDTAPGAGGWITSENMGDFMDEDGNFAGMGSLGPGAGTVRTREDGEEEGDVNGTGGEEDTKWQRTD